MMWTCPFQKYCGTEDLITIVPTYDGKDKIILKDDQSDNLKPAEFIFTKNTGVCSHRIKFPMDASKGDFILFKVDKLENVRL